MISRVRDIKAALIAVARHSALANAQASVSAKTIIVTLAVATFASLAMTCFYATISPMLSWAHASIGVLFAGAAVYFSHTLNYKVTARVCSACTIAVFTLVNWQFGGISSPAISCFIIPAFVSALVVGWRDGSFWLAVGCAITATFFILDQYYGLPGTLVIPENVGIAALVYSFLTAILIGMVSSFWVTVQHDLEERLSSSLNKSESETALASFLAKSATVANGSIAFNQVASNCLELLCKYRGWYAGRIWRVDDDGNLESSEHAIGFRPAGNDSDGGTAVAGSQFQPSDCVLFAASTREPTVNGGRDGCLTEEWEVTIKGILAWPIKVDGRLTFILEFYSESPIMLDPNTMVVAGHVATQLSHVEARESSRQEVEDLAFKDLMTGLPNRAGFEHLFEQKLKDAKRSGQRVALMFIDLDGFKRVNDSLGHHVGDNLLRTVAQRLEGDLRESDVAGRMKESDNGIAARLGGDEFTLVLSDIGDPGGAAVVARRFLDLLSEPIDVGSQDVYIGASIGIAIYPDDATSSSDLMRLADAAMYEAKEEPGNQYRYTTPALNDAIQRRLWVEGELHQALENDDLTISFLPIAAANSGRIIANEVAARWPHEEGEIAFKEFFEVAKTSSLVFELGCWVIEKACAEVAQQRWTEQSRTKTCIDISIQQLQQPLFVERVGEILRRYDCPRGHLELEISDTGAALKNEQCRQNIRQLHEQGVRIVLDKFGTGYSSLIDLCELPLWRIKLDRRFVQTADEAEGNRSMGRAIIAMAHSMGIETTIFNVETEAQAQWFRDLGCDALQGPYVGGMELVPRTTVLHSVDPRDVEISLGGVS